MTQLRPDLLNGWRLQYLQLLLLLLDCVQKGFFQSLKLLSERQYCSLGIIWDIAKFWFVFFTLFLQSLFELLLQVLQLETNPADLTLLQVELVFMLALEFGKLLASLLELVTESLLFEVAVHQRFNFWFQSFIFSSNWLKSQGGGLVLLLQLELVVLN